MDGSRGLCELITVDILRLESRVELGIRCEDTVRKDVKQLQEIRNLELLGR